MLIETDDGYLNTDHVVTATPLVTPNGGSKWSITAPDGSTRTVSITSHALEQACGVVVPALPGFAVMTAILPDPSEEGIVYGEEAVIAFRVAHGGSHEGPMPITVSGEPMGNGLTHWTIRQPNGRCVGPDGDYKTVEDWMVACNLMVARLRGRSLAP